MSKFILPKGEVCEYNSYAEASQAIINQLLEGDVKVQTPDGKPHQISGNVGIMLGEIPTYETLEEAQAMSDLLKNKRVMGF